MSLNRVVAALLVVAVAVSGVVLIRSLSADPERSAPPPTSKTSQRSDSGGAEGSPEPTPAPSAGSEALLYLKGTVVRRLDLVSMRDQVVAEMPTEDVWASPAGPWLAYIVPGVPTSETEPDFVPDPMLRVVNYETGEDREVGPGFQPTWHPLEQRLAYLRPVTERGCDGESCEGVEQLVTYDVATETQTDLTDPGRFAILSWAGDRVLISDEADLSETVSAGESETSRLELAPDEIWGASPDGSMLLRSAPGEVNILRLSDEGLGRTLATVEGRAIPADGEWAPDSSALAAVWIGPGGEQSSLLALDGSLRGLLDGPAQLRWAGDRLLLADQRAKRPVVYECESDGACERLTRIARKAILLTGLGS